MIGLCSPQSCSVPACGVSQALTLVPASLGFAGGPAGLHRAPPSSSVLAGVREDERELVWHENIGQK